jgi:phosphonate transport system substrate-binding protein
MVGMRSYGLAVCVALAAAPAGARPLTISSLPFDDPAQQTAVFGLLSKHLSTVLGEQVDFVASRSYEEVIARLQAGDLDVAFVGAAAYVQARKGGDVRAVLRAVRHHANGYRGVVIVPRASKLAGLADLKGKRVAFVDKFSTGGYFYPLSLLRQVGLDPGRDITAVFAGGHYKVAQMVARGEVDAGACYEGAEGVLSDPSSVRPIARTEVVPGDPVVVRPGLGTEKIQRLRSALIELPSLPEAQSFLTFAEIDGFVPALDRDYDGVAELMRKVE